MSFHSHFTIAASYQIKILVLPLGSVPPAVFAQVLSVLNSLSSIDSSNLSLQTLIHDSPFSSINWQKGKMRLQFLTPNPNAVDTTPPDQKNKTISSSAPDENTLSPTTLSLLNANLCSSEWDDMQFYRRIMGVICICHYPSASSLSATYSQFLAIKAHIKSNYAPPSTITGTNTDNDNSTNTPPPNLNTANSFNLPFRTLCYAFNPSDDVIDTFEREDLILFPNQGEERLKFYLSTSVTDLASRLLHDLEAYVLYVQKYTDTFTLKSPTETNTSTSLTSILPPSSTASLLDPFQTAKKKGRIGRQKKYIGDICLLVGSPIDASKHYKLAIEYSKSIHDHLWLAAALEGSAACLVLSESENEKPAYVDLSDIYNDVFSLYSRISYASVLSLESSFKLAYYYASHHKNIEAAELLMRLFENPLDLSARDQINMCVESSILCQQMGLWRKGGFFLVQAAGLYKELHQYAACTTLLSMAAPMYGIEGLKYDSNWSSPFPSGKQTDRNDNENEKSLDSYVNQELGYTSASYLNRLASLSTAQRKERGYQVGRWISLQRSILEHLVYSAQRTKNTHLAATCMIHLLRTLYSYLDLVYQRTLSSSLLALTDSLPINTPVDSLGLPYLHSVMPQPLPSHLHPHTEPIHSPEEEFPSNPNRLSRIATESDNVFLFAPDDPMADEEDYTNSSYSSSHIGRNTQLRYVCDEVFEVIVTLSNPLLVPIEIARISLSTEGVTFESYATSLTLPPLTYYHTIILTGKAISPGHLTIKGVWIRVWNLLCEHPVNEFGAAVIPHDLYIDTPGGNSNSLLLTVGSGGGGLSESGRRVKYNIRNIEIVAPLPILSVQFTLRTAYDHSLLLGEKRQAELVLENVGVLPVEDLQLRIAELYALNSDAKQAQYYSENEVLLMEEEERRKGAGEGSSANSASHSRANSDSFMATIELTEKDTTVIKGEGVSEGDLTLPADLTSLPRSSTLIAFASNLNLPVRKHSIVPPPTAADGVTGSTSMQEEDTEALPRSLTFNSKMRISSEGLLAASEGGPESRLVSNGSSNDNHIHNSLLITHRRSSQTGGTSRSGTRKNSFSQLGSPLPPSIPIVGSYSSLHATPHSNPNRQTVSSAPPPILSWDDTLLSKHLPLLPGQSIHLPIQIHGRKESVGLEYTLCYAERALCRSYRLVKSTHRWTINTGLTLISVQIVPLPSNSTHSSTPAQSIPSANGGVLILSNPMSRNTSNPLLSPTTSIRSYRSVSDMHFNIGALHPTLGSHSSQLPNEEWDGCLLILELSNTATSSFRVQLEVEDSREKNARGDIEALCEKRIVFPISRFSFGSDDDEGLRRMVQSYTQSKTDDTYKSRLLNSAVYRRCLSIFNKRFKVKWRSSEESVGGIDKLEIAPEQLIQSIPEPIEFQCYFGRTLEEDSNPVTDTTLAIQSSRSSNFSSPPSLNQPNLLTASSIQSQSPSLNHRHTGPSSATLGSTSFHSTPSSPSGIDSPRSVSSTSYPYLTSDSHTPSSFSASASHTRRLPSSSLSSVNTAANRHMRKGSQVFLTSKQAALAQAFSSTQPMNGSNYLSGDRAIPNVNLTNNTSFGWSPRSTSSHLITSNNTSTNENRADGSEAKQKVADGSPKTLSPSRVAYPGISLNDSVTSAPPGLSPFNSSSSETHRQWFVGYGPHRCSLGEFHSLSISITNKTTTRSMSLQLIIVPTSMTHGTASYNKSETESLEEKNEWRKSMMIVGCLTPIIPMLAPNQSHTHTITLCPVAAGRITFHIKAKERESDAEKKSERDRMHRPAMTVITGKGENFKSDDSNRNINSTSPHTKMTTAGTENKSNNFISEEDRIYNMLAAVAETYFTERTFNSNKAEVRNGKEERDSNTDNNEKSSRKERKEHNSHLARHRRQIYRYAHPVIVEAFA